MDLAVLIEDLRALSTRLPAAQREAFELVHIQRLSRAEAALKAGCTLPQLRDRLREARGRLRGWFEAQSKNSQETWSGGQL
jgi:DNA-directed RNA polymerase specialized sigma24 family protein